jgi:DNA mismatch repair protein MutL
MTAKIAILPDEVVTHIAAGEVIERPASVVKELIENAIDARCGRVVVEVEEAGGRLIRVTDDGEGMIPAEAPLAFQRYATSKIRRESDLCSLQTMGFRGEALPSIAAVSKVRLVTVAAGSAWGTELRLEGGSLKEEREAAAAPGTMVEVTDLFYNTPARKKFLKSPATEFGHICQVIQRQALAVPGVHFRLLHKGATVADYPVVRSLRERVQQVYGPALVEASVEVAGKDGGLCLEGLCCRPLEATATRTPQDLFVNRRWVKSPAVVHAAYDGYGTYLGKGDHPRFILLLTVDPRDVDVNVHPTKREVRFSDQERVHDRVRAWIRNVVGHESPNSAATAKAPWRSPVPEAPRPEDPLLVKGPDPRGAYAFTGSEAAAEAVQPYLPAVGQDVRPLGQIADRYLLAQVGEELQIIDQHTAHERVLYERLCAQFEQGLIPSQHILLPETMELDAGAAGSVRAHLADLGRLGFELEEFGHGTFLVRAIPALTGQADPKSLLTALVEEWGAEASTPAVREQYHAVLASLACHSAVRSGRRLELPEMRRLVEDWREAGLPSTCPHGRRIAMRLTIEELDRIFGRQGWA